MNYPASKVAEDGKFGPHIAAALMSVSDSGFCHAPREPVEVKHVPKSPITFEPSLHFGMSGSYVLVLQRTLKKLGIVVAVDGIFGKATFKAVKEYQASVGLNPDGVVGMGTRSHLGIT